MPSSPGWAQVPRYKKYENPLGYVELPEPQQDGPGLWQTIADRRSHRRFADDPISLLQLAQLVWVVTGVTLQESEDAFRAAASAGALYPLEVSFFAFDVTGLKEGVYQYFPNEHAIIMTRKGNVREDLCKSSLNLGES